MNKLIASIASLLIVLAIGQIAYGSPAADTHVKQGTIVSIGSGKLVLSEQPGGQITLTVADSVQVTISGKPAKLTDLKPGIVVNAMTNLGGEVMSISTVDAKMK